MIIGIFQGAIVFRILSQHEFGVKELALSIGGALGIYQHLGLASASTREVAAAKDNKERNTQEFKEKMNKGPVAFINMFPSGQANMGSSLAQWFVYCIIVGLFAAYIAERALEPGAHYLSVFRFAGATAFVGYSLALMQNSIWYRRSWSATLKSMFDGLIYALFTAGIFGWLWPTV